MTIRLLEEKDNKAIAAIIRATLLEFGAAHPGTVYYDPTTDDLFNLFKKEGSIYFVVEEEGTLFGGCGIFPSDGLPADTCELVKFYLNGAARGKGVGKALMQKSMDWAKEFGYEQIYLETMPELSTAIGMYIKMGYQHLPAALGNTGHDGCTIWMLKQL